jgi:hypothetical protein
MIFVAVTANSQVFNTGSTLKQGHFSIGLNPAYHSGGPSDELNMYFHGGFGIKSGLDISVKLGIGHANYIGADVEWALGRRFSLTTGIHDFEDFGLDGTINITFPITNEANLYTGLDLDLIFSDELKVPIWLPLGIGIGLRSSVEFILEAEIGLNDPGYHIISGGLNIYF